MNSGELSRWLRKLGATFEEAKGSHKKVTLNGRTTIIAAHGKKEIPNGTLNAIKRDLGLK
ncbi:MAG: type II toxin-antitoxin system HicA family toxin [Acidobacteria bacterium]|nr:type II toxin-antitoxin system HicA family toxin [Acidobacteriota bacterium]